jgi:hypothetical protein
MAFVLQVIYEWETAGAVLIYFEPAWPQSNRNYQHPGKGKPPQSALRSERLRRRLIAFNELITAQALWADC